MAHAERFLDLEGYDYLYQGGATFDHMIDKSFKAKKSFVVAIVNTRTHNTFDQEDPLEDAKPQEAEQSNIFRVFNKSKEKKKE